MTKTLEVPASPTSPISRLRAPALIFVFGMWSLVASTLLFWVELMVAKMLLPSFGGSASVWTTSLVFFQLNLLAGYAAAHGLARLPGRWHKAIQTVLVALPLLTLPVSLPGFLGGNSGAPVLVVLAALTLMVGAPFFALSTASPTLQTWFSRSSHPRAADPYFLYGLSNVGSVLGLAGYPLLVERLVPLHTQTVIWTVGYGIFAALTVAGAALVGDASVDRKRVTPVAGVRGVKWAGIAFIPSLMLMGVTQHLSTDVAAFPLLWTVPLALYLGSFALTFRSGGEAWVKGGSRVLRLLLVPAALFYLINPPSLWAGFSVPLILLAVVSVVGHGRVYAERPEAESLTSFYLWVSVGGAAGGLFASLIAPTLFDFVVEYPLALILAALISGSALRSSSLPRVLEYGLIGALSIVPAFTSDAGLIFLAATIVIVVAVLWSRPQILAGALALLVLASLIRAPANVSLTERTFFGVYRVVEDDERRTLMSGTTNHGSQAFSDGRGSLEALSYYHRDGPIGEIFEAVAIDRRPLEVGIVGLGIGGLVGYADSDDRITYYEIDPAVEEIARDTELFTLLAEAPADIEVQVGDGRLLLERSESEFDLLMIDAFTSDAIPVHLLTLEAVESYFEAIGSDGRVLAHISNRHLDLEPVLGRIAAELGVEARVRRFTPSPSQAAVPSNWVLLERPGDRLQLSEDWMPARQGDTVWTDDYSNIVSIIDWR